MKIMKNTLLVNLYAGPGAGKCFTKGTKVLMWNGETKNIEDITIGDIVMGDDSTPRKVLELHQGNAPMYILHRGHSKDIIVSSNHILSLMRYHVNKTWSYEDVSIEEYLAFSKKHKHYSRLYKKEINYPLKNTELKIDPYYLGYWLGDGLSNQLNRFCTADEEVVNYCRNYAKKLGLILKQHSYKNNSICQTYCLSEGNIGDHSKHPLSKNLYNLINNKHIPIEYKTATMKDRLELIAGLIDSDGSISRNSYDWINKNYQLAYDFYCIINSCGLRATMKKCTKNCGDFTGIYYRISITGDLKKIPVKIKRKQAIVNIKDTSKVLRETFTVEPIGNNDYYGFTTDGNNRFMLDDCTVVHNSTGAAYIFSKLKMAGIDSELVTEYAKDRVWQGDQFVLQHCQLYVTGKQCLKVARLLGKVDVIVTDSPIAVGAMYTDEKPYQDVCLYEAKKYKNTFNIFIDRKKDYNPNGRNQTFEEAKAIDQKILDFLDSNSIEYIRADGTVEGYDGIVGMIIQRCIKEKGIKGIYE